MDLGYNVEESLPSLALYGRITHNGQPLATPLHIRNAPTKLMVDVGYGKGYQYAHDYEDAFVAQEYLPKAIRNHRFYEPTDRGFEQTIRKRLAYWRHLKEGRAEPADPNKPQS